MKRINKVKHKTGINKITLGNPRYKDEEWFWTTEYIFYLEHYQIEIPDAFIMKMVDAQFKAPDRSEFDIEVLRDLEQQISALEG